LPIISGKKAETFFGIFGDFGVFWHVDIKRISGFVGATTSML
jgi:hypothetical protein